MNTWGFVILLSLILWAFVIFHNKMLFTKKTHFQLPKESRPTFFNNTFTNKCDCSMPLLYSLPWSTLQASRTKLATMFKTSGQAPLPLCVPVHTVPSPKKVSLDRSIPRSKILQTVCSGTAGRVCPDCVLPCWTCACSFTAQAHTPKGYTSMTPLPGEKGLYY